MRYFRSAKARAQRAIEDGERRIAAQEELIERLRSDGHSTERAEKVLEEMHALMRTMRKHLEEVEKFSEAQGESPDES